jgi:quercetin dioxygenase-like cupin family protein
MKKYKLGVSFSDKRGKIVDLLEKEKIEAVTYITFTKGAVRGNHYHKKTIQWCYVISGKILVRTKKPKGVVRDHTFKTGDFFVDEPLERHAFLALEDSEIMVFTRGPRGGKEYETDTFRDEVPLIDPK